MTIESKRTTMRHSPERDKARASEQIGKELIPTREETLEARKLIAEVRSPPPAVEGSRNEDSKPST